MPENDEKYEKWHQELLKIVTKNESEIKRMKLDSIKSKNRCLNEKNT